MLTGVEASLNQAMDKLPENVAEKVKGKVINRCGYHTDWLLTAYCSALYLLSTGQGCTHVSSSCIVGDGLHRLRCVGEPGCC